MFFRLTTDTTNINVTTALAELKTDSAYNSSVVLYASALLKNKERYSEALDAIEKQLAGSENNSFKAWMLGRVALAATHIEDKATVDKTVPVLKILIKEVSKDECHAWALGYLAAVNSAEFKENHQTMRNAADALTKPADALWAHVMNLQAAARERNKDIFNSILLQMTKFTGKTTVAEALAQVPANDWRAWALGIATESAAIMGEKNLYQELNQPLDAAIAEAVGAKSIANAMLAQINATTASAMILQQSASKLTL